MDSDTSQAHSGDRDNDGQQDDSALSQRLTPTSLESGHGQLDALSPSETAISPVDSRHNGNGGESYSSNGEAAYAPATIEELGLLGADAVVEDAKRVASPGSGSEGFVEGSTAESELMVRTHYGDATIVVS